MHISLKGSRFIQHLHFECPIVLLTEGNGVFLRLELHVHRNITKKGVTTAMINIQCLPQNSEYFLVADWILQHNKLNWLWWTEEVVLPTFFVRQVDFPCLNVHKIVISSIIFIIPFYSIPVAGRFVQCGQTVDTLLRILRVLRDVIRLRFGLVQSVIIIIIFYQTSNQGPVEQFLNLWKIWII